MLLLVVVSHSVVLDVPVEHSSSSVYSSDFILLSSLTLTLTGSLAICSFLSLFVDKNLQRAEHLTREGSWARNTSLCDNLCCVQTCTYMSGSVVILAFLWIFRSLVWVVVCSSSLLHVEYNSRSIFFFLLLHRLCFSVGRSEIWCVVRAWSCFCWTDCFYGSGERWCTRSYSYSEIGWNSHSHDYGLCLDLSWPFASLFSLGLPTLLLSYFAFSLPSFAALLKNLVIGSEWSVALPGVVVVLVVVVGWLSEDGDCHRSQYWAAPAYRWSFFRCCGLWSGVWSFMAGWLCWLSDLLFTHIQFSLFSPSFLPRLRVLSWLSSLSHLIFPFQFSFFAFPRMTTVRVA